MKYAEKKLICLQIHNDYQIPGGETITAKLIADMLEEFGIGVIRYYKSNDMLAGCGAIGKIKAGLKSIYNIDTEKELIEILGKVQVDFALIHNVSPIISNAVYKVLIEKKIPIIKYLQNYNLVCLNGALDNGDNCDKCQKNGLIGVKFACYKKSKVYSLIKYIIKRDMDKHYIDKISAFMPNSGFVKKRHAELGIDDSKMHVMYNYIEGARLVETDGEVYSSYLYFGRISREKGIFTVVKAFEIMPERELIVMGSGELEEELKEYIESKKLNNVHYIGARKGVELVREIFNAKCVIVSSEWDEPLPRTILESYLQGTPVLGTNRGGIPEMIKAGKTGFVYESGDIEALVRAVKQFEALTADEYVNMRENCLKELNELYTKEKYYERFMNCVKGVLS